jgi:hypothetical protein
MSETLVEALERLFPLIEYETSYDNCPRLIAEKAPDLLPLLVAHATDADKAALLRTLLGERLAGLGEVRCGGIVVEVAFSSLPSVPLLLNLLAPEVTP